MSTCTEKIDSFNAIKENLDQLESLLKEDFGVEVKVIIESHPKGFLLTSTPIKDMGIFNYAYEECKFDSFNIIKQNEDKYFIYDINLRYTYKGGGSNGCSLGKGYIYNSITKNWYRINKELKNFKAH